MKKLILTAWLMLPILPSVLAKTPPRIAEAPATTEESSASASAEEENPDEKHPKLELVGCRSKSYQRMHYFHYLEASSFTERSLRRLLSQYLEADRGEIHVVVTSAESAFLEFSRDFSSRSAYKFNPRPTSVDIDPIVLQAGPAAYFFNINGNAFMQWRDGGNDIHWVNFHGHNLFHQEWLGVALSFAGQTFVRWADDDECDGQRRITFIASGLESASQGALLSFFVFISSQLPQPSGLGLQIYSDFADLKTQYPFPSLEAVANLDRLGTGSGMYKVNCSRTRDKQGNVESFEILLNGRRISIQIEYP